MKTNRTWWMTVGALVIGGTMLMGAGQARADQRGRGDDHARYSQRDHDRGDYNRRRDYDRGWDRDDHRDSGVRVGVTWNSPAPVYSTTYVTRQVWVADAYVTQMQNVLVEPAHWEVVTVPAVTETRYPSNGRPYTVVIRPAHAERVWVADRYESRPVQVLVPGHWETVTTPVTTACPPPVYAPARTTISIGGIFRF